jgi:predicted ArsR family transcriptional regulator
VCDVDERPLSQRVAAVTALDEPIRRAMLEFVARSPEPVSRDAAATAFALPRSTAAFHLDRLAEQGLLDVVYRRTTGRTGPGSGRPAKLYRRSAREVSVSVPPRHYDLAARLLAAAVERVADAGGSVTDALAEVAESAGREMAADAGSLHEVLETTGFEPRTTADGTVELINCPFHQLVADHPQTVCTMNLHLLRGAACACGADPESLRLDPGPGRCCVTIAPDGAPSTGGSG